MSYDSLQEEQYRALLANSQCHLPKHAGESWEDIVKQDWSYARWAATALDLDEDLKEAIFWGVENRRDL